MATQIIKSVGATGRDYATWQLACAAIPLDLIGADENWIFEFYNDAEFVTPGTHMYLSSGGNSPRTIIADATRTVTCRPAAGQGFADHANKLANPLRYDQSKGVGILAGGGASTDGVFVDIPYALIEGLQLYGRADSVSVIWPTAIGSEVRSCLVSAFDAPQFPVRVSGGAKLTNSIVVCTGTSTPWGLVAMHGPGQVIGCTLVNIANNSAGTSGIFNNYGAGAGITLKDNVVAGVTNFVRDYNGLSGAVMWAGGTYSNNAFTGAIPIGSANVENIIASDQFVNVASAATLDLRPKAGNSLQAGVTDAALGGIDILKQTRAGTPTIGAMEYVAPDPNGSASGAPASITTTAPAATATGTTAGSGSASGALASMTLSAPTAMATGTTSGGGTITTDPFKNNTDTVLAAITVPKLSALKLSDMTLAASWTSQATNGSGVLSLTSPGLTAGTDYLLVTSSADGLTVGVKKYTAS